MSKEDLLNSMVILLRRATGIDYDVKDITKEMMNKIVKIVDFDQPLNVVTAKMKEAVNKYYNDIELTLEEGLLEIADTAVKVDPLLTKIPVTKKLVRDSLNQVMPDSNISTIDMIKRTKGVAITSVVNNAQRAYQEGWTLKQLRDSLRTSENQLNRHLSTIARTSTNAVSNHAKLELYNKNSDLIDRVLFSAHLDHRTSNICKELDGLVFKLKDAPKLPLHPNERSQLVPIMKGENIDDVFKEIGKRPAVVPKNKKIFDKRTLHTRTGKVRKPGANDYTPLKGETTTKLNYESWLASQPQYYKEAIIGKRAAKAFDSGVPLKDAIPLSPIAKKQLGKSITNVNANSRAFAAATAKRNKLVQPILDSDGKRYGGVFKNTDDYGKTIFIAKFRGKEVGVFKTQAAAAKEVKLIRSGKKKI